MTLDRAISWLLDRIKYFDDALVDISIHEQLQTALSGVCLQELSELLSEEFNGALDAYDIARMSVYELAELIDAERLHPSHGVLS